jgi:hypothetical protein
VIAAKKWPLRFGIATGTVQNPAVPSQELCVTKFCVIVLCVGLAACTNKKEQEGKEPVSSAPAPAAPAAPSAPPTASAPGSAAGSSAPGGTPGGTSGGTPGSTMSAAAASAGTAGGGATTPSPEACATPSSLHCDSGQVDGCNAGLTSVHLCVVGDAKAGAPCAQGAALTCPTGQIDACSFKPPYASTHICVIVPRPTP